MNRYIMIRRLRGPAFLLLVGVNALLNEAGILSWHHSWPLYLILIGVLKLAERAALAGEPPIAPVPGVPYPGAPYGGAPYPGAVDPAAVQGAPAASTSIVPAHTQEYEKEPNGGQS